MGIFGNSSSSSNSSDDNCTASGWSVRPAAANNQCPQGDHDAPTTNSGNGRVTILPHGRR